MSGRIEDLGHRAGFDDAPRTHDGDPVAHAADHGQVVGDEQIARIQFRLQILEQLQDLRLHRDIQSRNRFVEGHQIRTQDRRPGDRHPLSPAAGQLRGAASRVITRQRHLLQQIGDPLPTDCAVTDTEGPQRFGHDTSDGELRVQGRVRVLIHHLHLSPQFPQSGTAQSLDIGAAEFDGAPIGCFESGDEPSGGGLTGTGFPDDGEGFPPIDGEWDIVDRCGRGGARTVFGGEPFDPKQRRRRGRPAIRASTGRAHSDHPDR